MTPSVCSRLTDSLQLEHPIVLAPMAQASGAQLALACAEAGAFGLIGGGYGDLPWVSEQYAAAFAAEHAALHARLGIGFITWRLEQDASALDWVLDQPVLPKAVMLSFGQAAPFAQRIKERGIVLLCQIQRLEQLNEVLDCGADIVVAQGGEAGGHGMNAHLARSTITLVPELADRLAALSPQTLLLAAGGIGDGRGVAAALMLGADGALIGSRLWATQESLAPEAAKLESVRASGDQTARSSVFDILRQLPWPPPYDFRALRNPLYRHWEHQIGALRHNPELAVQDYNEGVAAQDYTRAHVTVGEAVGLIYDLPQAAELIGRIIKDMQTSVKRLNQNCRT
jgi:nitronate monooxygenase